MPPNRTLRIWKGNTITLQFRFRATQTVPFDLTGSEIVFWLAWTGGEIRRTSNDSGILIADPTSGLISIPLSAADTRAIPTGTSARYEIERRYNGTETSLIWGVVDVGEGINDDAP